jgi:Flp pilus assembly protein TadB
MLEWIFTIMALTSTTTSPLVTPQIAVGRYARLTTALPNAITHPLQAMVRGVVPGHSVRDAVMWALADTGYNLADESIADALAPALLESELATSRRQLPATTVEQFLIAIAQPGFRLVVDHVHRQIAFERMPRLRPASSGALK